MFIAYLQRKPHEQRSSSVFTLAGTSCLVLIVIFGFAQADVISVNFVGGQGGSGVDQDLVIDQADGAAGVVPEMNWNNLDGTSGGSVALIDSDGIATGATVSWGGSPNRFTTGNGSTTADQILMNGYLDTDNTSTTTVTVSNVPYAKYDVYVYFDGGGTGRAGEYTVNGTTRIGTDNANPSNNFTDTFLQDDGVGGGGNYLLFSGLTDADLTIAATPTAPPPTVNRAPINGFQIVEVVIPEPSSIAVWFGVAGFGLLRVRQKNCFRPWMERRRHRTADRFRQELRRPHRRDL